MTAPDFYTWGVSLTESTTSYLLGTNDAVNEGSAKSSSGLVRVQDLMRTHTVMTVHHCMAHHSDLRCHVLVFFLLVVCQFIPHAMRKTKGTKWGRGGASPKVSCPSMFIHFLVHVTFDLPNVFLKLIK